MAWLRLDDGFASHPKIAALNDREYRVWTRLLLYCARYRTEGKLPDNALVEIPQLTKVMLRKFRDLRLLDPGDIVHDWRQYNAQTIAEKVAAYLEEHPDATANEIHRVVGGKREIVLAEIHRQRSQASTAPVPEVVPEPVPDRYPTRARAGEPVPSSEKDVDDEASLEAEESSTSTSFSEDPDPASSDSWQPPPAPNGATAAQPEEELTPDPEGLARIRQIQHDATLKAAAEREDDASLDTDDALKRREASRRRLELLQDADA